MGGITHASGGPPAKSQLRGDCYGAYLRPATHYAAEEEEKEIDYEGGQRSVWKRVLEVGNAGKSDVTKA